MKMVYLTNRLHPHFKTKWFSLSHSLLVYVNTALTLNSDNNDSIFLGFGGGCQSARMYRRAYKFYIGRIGTL